jgi:hypothetical protein
VAELRGGVSGGARRRGHRHIDEWWPVAAGAELGFRDRWQGVTPGGGNLNGGRWWRSSAARRRECRIDRGRQAGQRWRPTGRRGTSGGGGDGRRRMPDRREEEADTGAGGRGSWKKMRRVGR